MGTYFNDIFVWNEKQIAVLSLGVDRTNVYEDTRNLCLERKWDELQKHFDSNYCSKKFKPKEEFIGICERKGYRLKTSKVPRRFYVWIRKTMFRVDFLFGFDSNMVKVVPCIKTHIVATNLRTPLQITIQLMETFARLSEELTSILEKAIHMGCIMETTTKIAYPYILSKIESSGYLDGLKHEVIEQGCRILLRIKDPIGKDGEYFEGEVCMDNLDIILETLPIALSDPENIEFYFPSFSHCWWADSKFK